MHIDLSGKVALITGGTRGIGRAIALELAKAGTKVIINYMRNARAAEEASLLIEHASGEAPLAVKANVQKEEDISLLFEKIQRIHGKLDILISNAATGVLKPGVEVTKKHWDWTMQANAQAFVHLVQRALPLMGVEPNASTSTAIRGRIIAISSMGSTRAIPDYALVGASKAALESLVRHFAVELAPKGVLVNTISAGVVDTEALSYFPRREQILKESRSRTPLMRLTEPSDVAKVALFLCSPLSDMICGQTIIVDGGYSIVA